MYYYIPIKIAKSKKQKQQQKTLDNAKCKLWTRMQSK